MAYDETFQQIVDNSNMVELVSEFVSLEKAGANYRGLCPFHHENTPSFYVSPEKKIATCFGCHKTLDPIGFIAEIKKISFRDAALYCAAKAGMKVDIKSSKKEGPDLSKYFEITKIAQEFYTKNLYETKGGLEALEYLNKRGLDKKTCQEFGIGLSSDKNDTIYQVLKSAGYLELDMVDAGLVKSNDNKYHDLFTRRIMFPILDADSNIIGYSGRIYHATDIKEGQPKYVNSNDNILFKKRLNLYNLSNAIPYGNKMHRFVLCEGQMDVIAASRAGFKEAICTLGTSLTKEQVQLIKRYVPEIILMYDNDMAGINASIQAIPLIKNEGINLKFVHLEGAKDADEYVNKYGAEKLKEFIDSHIITEYEFRYMAALYNRDILNESDFESAKTDIFKFLLESRSATIKERYLTKLSNDTGASVSALATDYDNYARRNHKERIVTPIKTNNLSQTTHIDNKYLICTRRIIVYATLSKDYAEIINTNLNLSSFDEAHKQLWAELYGNYYYFIKTFDKDKFLSVISHSPQLQKTFIDDYNYIAYKTEIFNEDDLNNCIETMNEYANIKRINELKTIIKDNYDMKYIEEFKQLTNKIKK